MASPKFNGSDSFSVQSLHSLTPTKTLVTYTQTEEAKLEREIIKAITSGKTESLKPNSGEAISIGEHYVCVSFHDETESDCRVWEWHGHVVSYCVARGYTQEYVNGSYFERKMEKFFVNEDEGEDEIDQEMDYDFGLRMFIGGLNLIDGRVPFWNLSDNSRRI